MSPMSLKKFWKSAGNPELLKLVRAVSEMVHIAYIRQKEALGLGHAILVARDLMNDEPFAVLLGDDVIVGGCSVHPSDDGYL